MRNFLQTDQSKENQAVTIAQGSRPPTQIAIGGRNAYIDYTSTPGTDLVRSESFLNQILTKDNNSTACFLSSQYEEHPGFRFA